MDFTRAITYPFEDPDWVKKLLIALVAGFIPIVGNPLALAGWSVELSQRVKNGHPTPLPEWENFGDIIRRGLNPVIAQLAYQIPTIIFFCIAMAVVIVPAMGGEEAFENLAGPAMIAFWCCMCIIVLYSIAAGIVYWGGYLRYLNNEELGTFFQFGDNIALVQNNVGDFLMVLVYFLLAGVIVGIASSITAGIGSILATPFMAYFGGHIIGQLAAKLTGGSPVSATPAV